MYYGIGMSYFTSFEKFLQSYSNAGVRFGIFPNINDGKRHLINIANKIKYKGINKFIEDKWTAIIPILEDDEFIPVVPTNDTERKSNSIIRKLNEKGINTLKPFRYYNFLYEDDFDNMILLSKYLANKIERPDYQIPSEYIVTCFDMLHERCVITEDLPSDIILDNCPDFNTLRISDPVLMENDVLIKDYLNMITEENYSGVPKMVKDNLIFIVDNPRNTENPYFVHCSQITMLRNFKNIFVKCKLANNRPHLDNINDFDDWYIKIMLTGMPIYLPFNVLKQILNYLHHIDDNPAHRIFYLTDFINTNNDNPNLELRGASASLETIPLEYGLNIFMKELNYVSATHCGSDTGLNIYQSFYKVNFIFS